MSLYVQVSPTPEADFEKFMTQTQVRQRAIEASSTAPLPKSFLTNEKAALLHPSKQELVVTEIEIHNPDVKSYTLMRGDRAPVGYFRAGQYLSVSLDIGGSKVTRPYSISSAPSMALEGKYMLTVKRTTEGFVSNYILDNWTVGTHVVTSGPLGTFYYEGLRDAKHVIGLAGGSGITPFLSMAYAIRDGEENFKLTLLYGSRTQEEELFQKEFAEIAAACPNFRLINVLSHEERPGTVQGFLTANLISKYTSGEKYSLFICGPKVMYQFLEGEIAKLGLQRKYVRRELLGIENRPWTLPGYPQEAKDSNFAITVRNCGEKYTISANSNEPVLVALERSGIAAPSQCRSGECGFCHSRLVSGNVFVPEDTDGRRAGDLVFGYIHPCCTFPLSDLEIDLPGAEGV